MALAAVSAGLILPASADSVAATATCGRNEIRLYEQPLAYEVVRDGKAVVPKTPCAVMLDGRCQKDAKLVKAVKARGGSAPVATPVYKKASVDVSAEYAIADFGDFAVRLAARADGVAWRFELKKGAVINGEDASLTVPAGARCWFNRTGDWGAEETVPEFADAAKLPRDGRMFYLPFAYSVDGVTVAVTESDLHDYPAWYLKDARDVEGGVRLVPAMERYPKATFRESNDSDWSNRRKVEKGGRWVRVSEHEGFLVKAEGARTLPWRVFILADSPSKLCEADIVYALATPAKADADFSWVKPGKVAWDWWNCFDNQGDKGCNTKTYERFIDFAAKSGVEYVIFDEGWSAALDIWKFHPDVDVPHLIDYAEKKGVGIILWMAWAQVYGDEEKVAEHFAKLGAKGFKVDFMDRSDAEIAVFLEKFAEACAKNRMLIDYHGAYRPVGLNRTYPNIVNYEGIHGLEQMKWAPKDKDMTFNDVACFFLRLTAGPMDYTPGAMLNHRIGEYSAGEGQKFPGSVGTRCHQMAMMALYEAYLQMLCDSPTNYEKNEECFKFMAATPVVWDETVGLPGCPETMAAVARKAKDGSWYASGLTNRESRDFELKTDFLGGGEWSAEIFRDAPESDAEPMKYVHETKSVKAGDSLRLHLASGGGFAIRFTK